MTTTFDRPEAWIGVDLDGTLAFHDRSKRYDPTVIGAPLKPMVDRIKYWLATGHKVKIFTARVTSDDSIAGNSARRLVIKIIQEWLVKECGLPPLEVTNVKDYACVALWDDIAVRMIHNTGNPSGEGAGGGLQ